MSNKKILFLTQYDESGASSRIYIYQFLAQFRAAGFYTTIYPLIRGNSAEIVFKPLATSKSTFQLGKTLVPILFAFRERLMQLLDSEKFDVVVLQKDVLPFGLLHLLRRKSEKLIFTFDDPIWIPHKSAASQIPLIGPLMTTYRTSCLISALKLANHVIVDNNVLGDFAEPHCRDISIITSPIKVDDYLPSQHLEENVPTVGWIGSPSTTHLLEHILPWLEELTCITPVRLVNIGGLPLQSSTLKIDNIQWTEGVERSMTGSFAVGLSPSEDEPFHNARFQYKTIQYAASGIPTVGPDVGLNGSWIKKEQSGLLHRPRDRGHFLEQMTRLTKSVALRREIGERARRNALARFDVRVAFAHWTEIIEKVLA